MSTQIDKKNLKNCACKNLRMTSRVLTQYYDKMLQPAGLRSTQFTLLVDISSREDSTIGELADLLLMDQTTVTRNVEILKKNGFIDVRISEEDSRRRCITITEDGRNKLIDALPLWEKAQLYVEQGIGKEKFQEFLNILTDIQRII
ncbi:winged helix-turn-helix transcriptional regulator [Clostridium sp. 19966]|uniref:MarR family winged helix-turn-helix transcriptional regulator n=1 Tax=Clostridium sp. 19966 TaxID=2768166 RepID=UPI0028DE7934|nr:MarR family winged helix-turn-helix transcriptional regulator [Clostridium sp. 19966]MDT8715097.1 winged helix-turn-helix transcriptional regulator [Clostridium sp. 19966]